MKLINKYKSLSIQAKAAIWFAFCSIFQKGIAFITSPIFARLLTTEEYGTYNLYVSWYSILFIVTSLSLFSGVFNNAMMKYKDKRDKYVSSMQGLTIVLTILFFIIYWIGHDWFNTIIGLSTTIMILMFVDLLVTPALQFWSARQRFEFRYVLLVIVTMIQAILNPALGIVAVYLTNSDKSLARIISIVAVNATICIALIVYQFSKGKSFFNKEYWKYAVCFNLPLLPHYLSGVILNQGDRVMINLYKGKTAVAVYSVAYNIGMLLNVFVNAFNGAFTPWMYDRMENKKFSEIRRVFSLLCVIMLALVFLISLVAPEIIWLFGSENYYEAKYVTPSIAASVFFLFVYIIFANVEFFYERTKFAMIASIATAALNIGLNAIFIPIYGYIASAYTTLVCYIVFCVSHWICCHVICKKVKIEESVYDLKIITLLSVIAIGISVGMPFLYLTFWYIRYILLALIGVVAFIFRKKILSALSIFTKKEEKQDENSPQLTK